MRTYQVQMDPHSSPCVQSSTTLKRPSLLIKPKCTEPYYTKEALPH